MSNKWKIVAAIIVAFFASVSSAKKEPTYTVNSPIMKKMTEWVDSDTIVFIDLEDVAMVPKSLMFSRKSPYRSFIDNLVALGNKVSHYNFAAAKWYEQREVKLVEDGWPEYINDLRRKGAAVYGVTKMPLHLVNIEQKRYQETQSLNLGFSDLVNEQEAFIIEKEYSWFSFFYKGIIFTGPYSRSHTLLEFLKVSNIVPPKILYISYSKPDLDRVDEELRAFNMKFYNIRYLAIEDLPGRPDGDLVQFQQQELIRNGRWMEDDVAKIALEQYKKSNKPKSTGAR